MRVLEELSCSNHSERKNLGYRLVEPPVVDSLLSLTQIPQKNDVLVVGGTAVSLYCYDKMPYQRTRQTDDVDAINKSRMTRSTFRDGIGSDICYALRESGYQPSINQAHKNFAVEVIPQDNFSEAFYVAFPRMSETYWNKIEPVIKKEFEGMNEVKIPGRNEKVPVVAFEDALAPKIIMGREKDKLDVASAIKYGPEVQMKRLEDMLALWLHKSHEEPEKYVNQFKQIKAKIL